MRFIWTVLLTAAASTAQTTPTAKPGADYGIPPSSRDAWQKPDLVISSLKFAKTETVAVVENGYPYFAPRIAPFVSKVYAVNSDARAFQGPGKPTAGITPVVSSKTDPGLPRGGVDTIILVEVLRQLTQRSLLYLSLLADLKPGGRLVIIDRNLPAVIPSALRLSDTDLQQELRLVGFPAGQKISVVPYQYMLVFQR